MPGLSKPFGSRLQLQHVKTVVLVAFHTSKQTLLGFYCSKPPAMPLCPRGPCRSSSCRASPCRAGLYMAQWSPQGLLFTAFQSLCLAAAAFMYGAVTLWDHHISHHTLNVLNTDPLGHSMTGHSGPEALLANAERSGAQEQSGVLCLQTIRTSLLDVREKAYERSGLGSSYLFRIDESWAVDATRQVHTCPPFRNPTPISFHSISPASYQPPLSCLCNCCTCHHGWLCVLKCMCECTASSLHHSVIFA